MKLLNYEFKPTWVSILLALTLVTIFGLLGRWQLHRAMEKQAIAGEIRARARAPELEILAETGRSGMDGLWYRRAVARGRFENRGQLLIDNILHQGRPGFYVLTPLVLGDGSTRVLVNRGWVPQGRDRRELPEIGVPAGQVVVHGIIDRGPRQAISLGQPGRLSDKGPSLWLALDYAEYARQRGVALLPLTLNEDPDEAGGYARDWAPFRTKTGMHYGYAIQWFAFAVIVLVVFVYTGLKRAEGNDDGDTQE